MSNDEYPDKKGRFDWRRGVLNKILRRARHEVHRIRTARSYANSHTAVLVIGDSISEGYVPFVKLPGVHVEHCHGNAGHSAYTLDHLDEYITYRPRWDVIVWNNGLHDLRRYDDDPVIPLPQYCENLATIAQRLILTGADVIFATTTHVPDGAANRSEDDTLCYNKAAIEKFNQCSVSICYLHTVSLSLDRPAPDDVHFTEDGYKALGAAVATSIAKRS